MSGRIYFLLTGFEEYYSPRKYPGTNVHQHYYRWYVSWFYWFDAKQRGWRGQMWMWFLGYHANMTARFWEA